MRVTCTSLRAARLPDGLNGAGCSKAGSQPGHPRRPILVSGTPRTAASSDWLSSLGAARPASHNQIRLRSTPLRRPRRRASARIRRARSFMDQ
jgi:hypothetical protein